MGYKCYCDDCGEDRELADVADLHRKFSILGDGPDGPAPLTEKLAKERVQCMSEELREFAEAIEAGDFPGMADALVDLVYFAKGTAVMMGLPWAELWADVHRANVSKVRGVGHRGHAVDLVKPPGWEGPKTEAILRKELWTPETPARGYDDDKDGEK